MTSRTGSAEDLGIFWKRQLVELKPASAEDGWLSLVCRGLGQVPHEMGGGRWKTQNRKNVYLSPYVEEPLNSKVIKSFVPELRSRKCFSCFEFPMFYVIYIYIWTLYVHFTHSRIWLWYRNTTFPNITEQMLTQEDKINIKLIKNHDWKEDYITISHEPKLEKCQSRNRKDKQIIHKFPNKQHHGIKGANLCRS